MTIKYNLTKEDFYALLFYITKSSKERVYRIKKVVYISYMFYLIGIFLHYVIFKTLGILIF